MFFPDQLHGYMFRTQGLKMAT